ncbi:hypothetical protein [Flavobacterium sp. JP2137]|uniref:hypothetical protein n=1 Tax=Flavobacterium sp. JP2137 TaxID=3414510 RepID=UPI003D2FA74F
MKNHGFAFVFLALATLTGCQDKKETLPATPINTPDSLTAPTDDKPETPAEVAEYRIISNSTIDDLNQRIAAKKITSEEEMMHEYSPKDKHAEANYKYVITKLSSGNGKTLVQLLEENLSDDSVKDRKVIMRVVKNSNGKSSVDEIKESYICRLDRGQQEWSASFCQ